MRRKMIDYYVRNLVNMIAYVSRKKTTPSPSYCKASSRAARCAARLDTEDPDFAAAVDVAVRFPNTLLKARSACMSNSRWH